MTDDAAGFWIDLYGPIAAEPQFRIGWCAHDDGAALADNPYAPFSTPYHAWNAGYLASKQADEDEDDENDDDDDENC
jgi:hypothetical protein